MQADSQKGLSQTKSHKHAQEQNNVGQAGEATEGRACSPCWHGLRSSAGGFKTLQLMCLPDPAFMKA